MNEFKNILKIVLSTIEFSSEKVLLANEPPQTLLFGWRSEGGDMAEQAFIEIKLLRRKFPHVVVILENYSTT